MDGPLAALVVVALGASIGTLQGALGAGGAILTIPALVHIVGVPLEVATVTSLVVTLANAVTGATQALRDSRAELRTGLTLGAIGVAGAFVGAWLHRGVDDAIVLALFSGVMLAAAATMLRQPVTAVRRTGSANPVRMVAVGTAVGLMTGFFGVGGGFLLVPALVAALGVPMRFAPGTSMIAIALNATWGLIAHLGGAPVDVSVAVLFGGAGVSGVVLGGKLARRLPDSTMRRAFATLVAALAVVTFVRDLPALSTLIAA